MLNRGFFEMVASLQVHVYYCAGRDNRTKQYFLLGETHATNFQHREFFNLVRLDKKYAIASLFFSVSTISSIVFYGI